MIYERQRGRSSLPCQAEKRAERGCDILDRFHHTVRTSVRFSVATRQLRCLLTVGVLQTLPVFRSHRYPSGAALRPLTHFLLHRLGHVMWESSGGKGLGC